MKGNNHILRFLHCLLLTKKYQLIYRNIESAPITPKKEKTTEAQRTQRNTECC